MMILTICFFIIRLTNLSIFRFVFPTPLPPWPQQAVPPPSPLGVTATRKPPPPTPSALETWDVLAASARTVHSQEGQGWLMVMERSLTLLLSSWLTPPSLSSQTRTLSSTWHPRWLPGSWRTGSTSQGETEQKRLSSSFALQVPASHIQWFWQRDQPKCEAGGKYSPDLCETILNS